MMEQELPPGTPVLVKQSVQCGRDCVTATVTGTIEAWEQAPTGSWFAHHRQGRFQLRRLRLRKADGEITVLIVDDGFTIARLQAAPAGTGA